MRTQSKSRQELSIAWSKIRGLQRCAYHRRTAPPEDPHQVDKPATAAGAHHQHRHRANISNSHCIRTPPRPRRALANQRTPPPPHLVLQSIERTEPPPRRTLANQRTPPHRALQSIARTEPHSTLANQRTPSQPRSTIDPIAPILETKVPPHRNQHRRDRHHRYPPPKLQAKDKVNKYIRTSNRQSTCLLK